MGKSLIVIVVATLKTVDELNRVKETIKKLPSVSELRTNVWTGIRNIPENLSIIRLKKKAYKVDTPSIEATNSIGKTASKIDETGTQIVEKLAKNGRVSFRKIAEDLNISTNTVVRRYEKLKRSGTIKVSIQIDPIKIGYRASAWFYVAFSSQTSLSAIVETIANIPDVNLIVKTSGVYDLLVEAMIRDIEQSIAIQDEIASIEGVAKMETHVIRPKPMLPLPQEYISTF